MWTLHRQQQQRGAQLHARAGKAEHAPASAVEGREALLVDAASVVRPLEAVDAIYAAADSPLPSYYREWAS